MATTKSEVPECSWPRTLSLVGAPSILSGRRAPLALEVWEKQTAAVLITGLEIRTRPSGQVAPLVGPTSLI